MKTKTKKSAVKKSAVKKVAPKKLVAKKSIKAPVKAKLESKADKIKKHLVKFKSITSLQAIKEYNVTRLSALIFNLKKEGMAINSDTVVIDGGRFAKYTFKK